MSNSRAKGFKDIENRKTGVSVLDTQFVFVYNFLWTFFPGSSFSELYAIYARLACTNSLKIFTLNLNINNKFRRVQLMHLLMLLKCNNTGNVRITWQWGAFA